MPEENGLGTWLFLVYRIPREPSAGRVFTWRKLQQLDAISLQVAIWFIELVKGEYRAIISALKIKDRDLGMLSKRFQEAQSKDFFASSLGPKTLEKLLAAGGLDESSCRLLTPLKDPMRWCLFSGRTQGLE